MYENQGFKAKKQQYHSDHRVANIEKETGLSFQDVKIHYDSDQPKRYQANAIAYGKDVFLKSGHENQLLHELGHIKQQEYGLVKANGFINGMQINTENHMEDQANVILDKLSKGMLQPKGRPVTLVQRAFDASAALEVFDLQDINFKANQLVVNSIKLSGRPETKLKSEGSVTQGDHIIADALIKKYQKVMIRNRTVEETYGFYYNLCDQVMNEDQLALLSIQQQHEPKVEIATEVQKRITASAQKAKEIQSSIEANVSTVKTQQAWRKELTSILYQYNSAYAESYFATHGQGTGGKDEKTGMQYVRETLSGSAFNLKPTMFNKLMDKDSLHRAIEELGNLSELQKLELTNLVETRFHSMIIEMANYRHQNSDATWQDIAPYLYQPVKGGYSGLAAQITEVYADKFMLHIQDIHQELVSGLTQIRTNLQIMQRTNNISFTNFKNTIGVLKKMSHTYQLIPDDTPEKQRLYGLIQSIYDPFIVMAGDVDVSTIISAAQNAKKVEKKKQQEKKALQKEVNRVTSMKEAYQISNKMVSVKQESREMKEMKNTLLAAFSSDTDMSELPEELQPVYAHVMELGEQIPEIIHHIDDLMKYLA